MSLAKGAERRRLDEARSAGVGWRKWGPYLGERQWGTVREDDSVGGDPWSDFTHDHARSRVYRWGEDGIAGVSDDKQRLCFSLALWNGKDPILKERLFGLTNSEGNHGEDVKEYYFYLDSTPTHSYMKYLYKYPQAAYPYDGIVTSNRTRTRRGLEYELLDTGIFDSDRYFDVFVEYAKASPEDVLVQITVVNRGPEAAPLHVLPTIWFRNEWSWGSNMARPALRQLDAGSIGASHPELGLRRLFADGEPEWLFTENETNLERFGRGKNSTPFVKDGINNYIVEGQGLAVNHRHTGTKAAAHYALVVGAGATHVIRLRLSDIQPAEPVGTDAVPFGPAFDAVMADRRREADEFYAEVIPASLGADGANVMRQALAGMLWSKQFYSYRVDRWLSARGADAPKSRQRSAPRNDRWRHMNSADIISVPDKWEYPWYAAWDLAFHVLALTLVDEDFGRGQLDLTLQERYLHPSGQIPACEWNFDDVNPPVQAWSTIFTYRLEQARRGKGDLEWLERSLHKLMLNFSWWVNRKDPAGASVLERGFLGLDNIGVFDRRSLPSAGGHPELADSTAWMALFCQNMLEIAGELALDKPAYADMCLNFIEHYVRIASSMVHSEDLGMWDEEDGFFYDVLKLPGSTMRLKVRSMAGLVPLCAVTVFDGSLLKKYPKLVPRLQRFLDARPELAAFMQDPRKRGENGRVLVGILNEDRLRRVLATVLDEREFLSAYGIRSMSKHHAAHPCEFRVGDETYRVAYRPAESDTGMFGGNSNWRGPIWVPVNALVIRALLQYHMYYGDRFTVECPTGSGRRMTLHQVAGEIARRLTAIFLRDGGRRPVYGGATKFQQDPHWRDLLLFYEYFHGENGAGLGASHQTGWTGVVARMMHLFATTSTERVLDAGKSAGVTVARPVREAGPVATVATGRS